MKCWKHRAKLSANFFSILKSKIVAPFSYKRNQGKAIQKNLSFVVVKSPLSNNNEQRLVIIILRPQYLLA